MTSGGPGVYRAPPRNPPAPPCFGSPEARLDSLSLPLRRPAMNQDTTESALAKLRIDRSARRAVRGRGRRWPVLLVVAALLGGGAWLFRDSVKTSITSLAAKTYKTGSVIKVRLVADKELSNASGYVVARTRAAIATKIAGRIERLHVDVGARVEKGQELAILEHRDVAADLAAAEAILEQKKAEFRAAEAGVLVLAMAVARARGQMAESAARIREDEALVAEALRVVRREEELVPKGASTEDNLARARNEHAAAVARLDQARARHELLDTTVRWEEAQLSVQQSRVEAAAKDVTAREAACEIARSRLADTRILAPFAGIVLRKEAEEGEIVVPALAGGGTSRGAVLTLADFSTLEMEVDVFERDLHLVKEKSPALIVLDAYPDSPFDGTVRLIEPTANREKATVQVRVAFDRLDGRVLPEMGGRAIFLKSRVEAEGEPVTTVRVPTSALTERNGQRGVFIVRFGVARFAPLELGEARPTGTEVKSGLSGGETVILEPDPGLGDGDPVKVDATS